MKIGVIGAGRIGGNCARQALRAGNEVMVSFSRDRETLDALAGELGPAASAGTPAEAAAFGEVVIMSVPWSLIEEAIAETGGAVDGKIVIDTTNQFGSGPMPDGGQTAAALNASRMPGARYTKSFNTMTSGFQAEAASRIGADRVVQWIAGDDAEAKRVVADLIESMGYVPIDLGSTAGCAVMEAPRRDGAVYGEEYRAVDAQAVVDAVRAGSPIPPTPRY